MLSIIFIYFVGKAFYDLAKKYSKSEWGFAILGVATYYVGLFGGAFIVGVIIEINSPGYVDDSNSTFVGLLGIPVGIAACWGTYTLLKKSWSKPKETDTSATLDGGLISTDTHSEDSRYTQDER
jgi:uncharacterized membrane protein